MMDEICNKGIVLSIIVPVCNVALYLEQCLESLVNQILKNIEIIIVDDGSNDGSEFICDRYAVNYPFVNVIHQKKCWRKCRQKKCDAIYKWRILWFL